MHKPTTSPSTAVRSTNNDCVASQSNTINETASQTHTVYCVRAGCPVVIVYDVGTDWRTVSCLINDHALVCKGGLRGLANSPPQSDALRPPRLAPASWGIHGGNRGKAIPNRRKKHKKEHQRKQELEADEYTEDVKPKSVKCRGCQQTLKLDKRSRYYPGLWLKHRKKCRGILKMEADKRLAREREWGFQSSLEQHPPAAASFEASGEESDKEADEYECQPHHIMGFSSKSVLDGSKCPDSSRNLASYVRGSQEGGEK